MEPALSPVAIASRSRVDHHFAERTAVQVLECGDRFRKRIYLVDDGTDARDLERVIQSLETPPATDEHAADGEALAQQQGDVSGQREAVHKADQRDVAIPGRR